jgi:hypothetical protein
MGNQGENITERNLREDWKMHLGFKTISPSAKIQALQIEGANFS